MKKDDISLLLQRYLDAQNEGKEIYFDADEFNELLDSFERSEEYNYYDEILALGLKLHPDSIDLQVKKCKSLVYSRKYEDALIMSSNIVDIDNVDLDFLRLESYCALNRYDSILEYIQQLTLNKCPYIEAVYEFVSSLLNDAEGLEKECCEFIDKGMTLYPNNLSIKEEYCYSLENKGKYKEAIDVCNELIDSNPYSHHYWLTLGRLHSTIADYEKAIEDFDFALTCNDSDLEIKILKAYCLYMNENYEKAFEVYSDISQNKASDEETLEKIKPLMAECMIKLGKHEQAYHILKEIFDKNKKEDIDASTYLNYIQCCAETERDREAAEKLLIASQLYPNDTSVLSILALTYLENGEDERALSTTNLILKILDELSEETPESYKKILKAGHRMYKKGNPEKALEYYKKLLEIDPDMPEVHIHVAMAYLAMNKIDKFLEHYKHTTPEATFKYMKENGFNLDELSLPNKHIPPEDLAKEFLSNKDNSN